MTALAAGGADASGPLAVLAALATVALVLDAVDGWVARRTGTVSRLGAALRHGGRRVPDPRAQHRTWRVRRVAGCSRSAPPATRCSPPDGCCRGCARPLPPRSGRKVVAAVQGVVLTAAASGLLPRPVTVLLLVVALALLAESFGRQVVRCGGCTGAVAAAPSRAPAAAGPRPRRSRLRTAVAVIGAASAVAAAWARPRAARTASAISRPAAFLRIPSRGSCSLRPRSCSAAGRAGCWPRAFGSLLGRAARREGARHGLPHGVRPAVRPAQRLGATSVPRVGVLGDSVGRTGALAAVVARRGRAARRPRRGCPSPRCASTRLVAEHRRGRPGASSARSARPGWSCAVSGVQLAPGCRSRRAAPPTSPSTQVDQVRADLARPADVRARRSPRPAPVRARRTGCSPGCAARTCCWSSSRATAGSPSRARRSRRRSTPCSTPARERLTQRRVLVAQRVPHLADVRRRQLAGARDAAVRAVGRQPAALRPAAPRRPVHADRARSASAGWRTVFDVARRHPGLAGGPGVLPLRPALRPRTTSATAARRSATPPMPDQYTLAAFAAARADAGAPPPGDGRDRPRLQPPPVDAAAPVRALGRRRRRLGLRRHAGAGPDARARCSGDPDDGAGAVRRSRSSTRWAAWSRSLDDLPRPGPRAGPARRPPAALVRHRRRTPGHDVPVTSSPRTRRAGTDRPAGAGRTGCCPRPHAPVWRMDAFRDRFLTAFGTPAAPSAAPAAAVATDRPAAGRS